MNLVDAVYVAVRTFPSSELFCLSQQMRKAAIAIPSDLAEGRGRFTLADQRHFYREARGSTQELETEIEIAVRQKFIPRDAGNRLIAQTQEVGRLINGLLRHLETPKA